MLGRGELTCLSLTAQVQAQVRESVRLLFAEEQQDEALEQLLQSLAARFVSKEDLQAALQVLELRILTNVTQHMAVTKQAPTSEAVLAAVAEAGLTGITEAVSEGGACRGHSGGSAWPWEEAKS